MIDDTSYEDLKAKYDALLKRLTRSFTIEQELINTGYRLERELARFGTIYAYSQRLIPMGELDDFAETVAEAVVDVFEVEIGVLWLLDTSGKLTPRPAGLSGCDDEDLDWTVLRAWLQTQGFSVDPASSFEIITRDDLKEPTLPEISQLVTSPLRNTNSQACGLVLGMVTTQNRLFYDTPTDEYRGSFNVYAQLISTLLQNRSDQAIIQRQLNALKQSESELIMARDVSEAANRAKSIFLANMSHEMRTPLNGVLGMTELLFRSGHLEGRQQHLAKMAHRSAQTLLGVINDILDFSKIEAGRMQLAETDFNLRRVLEDCLELVANQAKRKGLELNAEFPTDMRLWVKGDPVRIRQVLLNLLGNAVKFTKQGEVRLKVAVRSENEAGLNLEFKIEDTGPGIDPAQGENVFKAFEQVDGSNTRQHDGTGLGLAITRQLVILMGGQVDYTSTPGHGTCFRVCILLKRGDTSQVAALDFKCLSGIRTLVVDDHPTTREVLCRQLTDWGMLTSSAACGAAALERLREAASDNNGYKVALIDRHLPDFDGIALAYVIQADPKITPLQLIILGTADSDMPSLSAHHNNISYCFSKPLYSARLYECLCSALDIERDATSPEEKADFKREYAARILLVEDNPVNQEVAMGMLEFLGCEVDVASDGIEALDLIAHTEYRLILMDCHMPGMNGFDATKIIRQLESEHSREPVQIIALTADVEKGIKDRCRKAGMNGYIGKPFELAQLRSVLGRD